MKVKMLTSLSGPKTNVSRGGEYECDAEEAKRLIEAGYAVPVKTTRKKAVKQDHETR